MWLGLAVVVSTVASIAAPYILPSTEPDKSTDTLFKLSLIAGIIVSGFAIYGYLKGR